MRLHLIVFSHLFPGVSIQASLEKAGAMSGGRLARQWRSKQAKEEFHHFLPIPKILRDFQRRIPSYMEAEVKNAEG
jgi:hypothetical protein